MNSIRGSDSLSRNLAVTLSAVSVQGKRRWRPKLLVKVDFHSVGANGYDPVAFVMGGKAVKGKARQPLTAEAFIEIWTNGQNNGRLAIAVMTRVPLECWLFFVPP